MKIFKYAILIGLIAYGQSIFAMEQIENAEAIQKMSLRELAKYRAKMNELAESMPNARQKAKFRDAYTEQINLASTETVSASSAQAMANLPQLPTEQEKQDFYAEIKRLRDAEYGDQYAVSWIPRAQYTYNAIQSLEAQLKKIREEEVSATAATKAALEKRKAEFKKIISEYARAGLAGYDNNHDANKRYKKEEESKDVNLFGKLLKDLTANANVSWFGYNIPKTDTYKPTDK